MAKSKQDYKKYVEGMLECCVCLETVRDPHTLQGCFHSVCKECLDQLLRQEERGLTCPVCRTFSARENIRANFFVRGLAEMHMSASSQSGERFCEQCPNREEPSEACSKCLDCKMDLCPNCRDAHLNVRILQGHRILPLTETTELIVDQLVFCVHHPDDPIKLFCQPCHTPVCLMCTATQHRGHECDTIQETLDKMVPQWEKNITYIDKRLKAVNKSTDKIEQKIKKTRDDFQRCVNQIDKKAEERIAEIRAMQQQMKAHLRTRENGEIEKLEKVKRGLSEKKRDGENVRRVARTSLDRARHASLMTELLQDGLGHKMEALMKWEGEEEEVEVDVPEIKGGDTAMDANIKAGLLGQVIYNTVSFLLMLGSVFTEAVISRVWDVDVEEYFNKKFTLVKEIKLADTCVRITPIKHHIWAPLLNSNKIQIYSRSCELFNTIEIQNPVSVAQASNGDIFIACRSGSGLYITTGIDQTLDLITTGDFCDVYSYDGKMNALNMGESKIHQYVCNKDDHSIKQKWSQVKSIDIHKLGNSYINTLIVDQSGFYVTARDMHMIYHYNETGRCLQTFTDSLDKPLLCGIDNSSNMIVANKKVINTVRCEQEKAVALKQLKTQDVNYVFDVRLDTDGRLWLLYYNAGEDCISKYELINEQK